MINPSSIDLKSLPWLPLTEKAAFPKQAAIYFAIDSQGCVQYIGRSVNVRARWGNHHKFNQLDAIGNVKIAYLFVDLPELLPQIETALIEYFQPPLNIISGVLPKKSNTKQIKYSILFLSPEMIKKLRLQSVLREISMSELAEMIFEEWLANND